MLAPVSYTHLDVYKRQGESGHVFVDVLIMVVPVCSVSLVMGLAAKAGTETAASIAAASAI